MGTERDDPSSDRTPDEDTEAAVAVARDGSDDGDVAMAPIADDDARDRDDVDMDLLPNGECVLRILDRNGGQIRQTALVEETGWSKAKVSRVLSQMETDDEIVKVSVGRGNLVTTPEDVPSGARSPFEE